MEKSNVEENNEIEEDTPTGEISNVAKKKCSKCHSKENLWICSYCDHIGCSYREPDHAHGHFRSTGHAYAMNLKAGLVWDFDRDNYIHDLARNGTYEIESDTPRNIKIYQTTVRPGRVTTDQQSRPDLNWIANRFIYCVEDQSGSQRKYDMNKSMLYKYTEENSNITVEASCSKSDLQQEFKSNANPDTDINNYPRIKDDTHFGKSKEGVQESSIMVNRTTVKKQEDQTLQAEINHLKQDLDQEKSDHDKLKEDFKQEKSNHDKLKEDFKQEKSNHDKLKEDFKQEKSNHDKLKEDFKQEKSNHDKLKEDFKQEKSNHDKLKEDFKQEKSNHDKSKQDLEACEVKNEELEKNSHIKQKNEKELNKLQQKLKDTQKELGDAKVLVDQSIKNCTELKAELQKKEEEIEELKLENRDLMVTLSAPETFRAAGITNDELQTSEITITENKSTKGSRKNRRRQT